MAYYFAAFLPVREGGYAVEFPDFPEITSNAQNLEDCMVMAADALALTVEEYAKARKTPPLPSGPEQARAWAKAQKNDPVLASGQEILLQLFRAPDMDMTPVKITISLPKSTLAEIDAKARQAGLTRSGFLAAAAGVWPAQA